MKLAWFTRKRDSELRKAESPSRAAVREELASEHCSTLLAESLERFPELEPERAAHLVQDVVEGFFYEVMDLGASESYHHASLWGLAEHSLEVAAYALRIARSRHFVGHAAPNPEEEAFRLPRLRYGCFLFALYHDLGKVLQAGVLGPEREIHNPFVEPLGAFYDRHGRDRCRIEWRDGRGLEDHVRLTPYLVGHTLPRTAADYLGAPILAEIFEEKTAAAGELREIIAEADQHSVREDRRKAEAKAQSTRSGHASGSFIAYLARSFAEGIRLSRLAVNVFGGDVLLGRRFAFFSYPTGVLKLVALVRECFGPSDVAARMLVEDEGGARFFLAKLKSDEGLFIDPQTGLWKLKATIQLGGESEVKEGILIPLAHLGLKPGAGETFPGTIAFSRPGDGSELVIDDFRPAVSEVERPAVTRVGPPAGARAEGVRRDPIPAPRSPSTPPPAPSPAAAPSVKAPACAEASARPATAMPPRTVPATLGPPRGSTGPGPAGIDPESLMQKLVEGIVAGWIPTNVPQAQVYVSPKTTFVATPAVFMRMRERGLFPDFDPQDRRSAYLQSLSRLACVRKSPTHRIVYPIMLGPESERPLKVIKFETLGLFKSKDLRDRVGLWSDWERIIELPQGWKPGDAVLPEEELDV